MRVKNQECQLERNMRLELSKHRKGFTTYSLESGKNSVLILTVEENIENTSTRLARELILEFKGDPPLNQPLGAEEWFEKALYKYGGPQLQYESQKASGSLLITSLATDGACHGTLKLTFSAPDIDVAGVGDAPIETDF